jgi:hypothetical protein
MEAKDIERRFRATVDDSVRVLEEDGEGWYRVLNPFVLDDGDHLPIALQRTDGGWQLSDGGRTLRRCAVERGVDGRLSAPQQRSIAAAMTAFDVQARAGALWTAVPAGDDGSALDRFARCLLQILKG